MKKLKWVLLPLVLATSWTLASRGPSHQMRLRRELLEARQRFLDNRDRCQANLAQQFTPGYKAYSLPGGVLWTQGEIFRTQASTNLAINGQGCFALRHGHEMRYTRDGRFEFREGVLRSQDGWDVLGYRLDSAGRRFSDPDAIRLSLDPQTALYEKAYESFHFDERGCLYGDAGFHAKPLYQLALYSVPGPNGLKPATPTSYEGTATGTFGVAGQGALGSVCPGSLELSNVDFGQQGLTLMRTRQLLEPFTSTASLPVPLDSELERACLDNLTSQMTPGTVPYDILGYLSGKGLHLRKGPGQLVETKNPFDLAVDGQGFLMLSGGNITRSASFTWAQGSLRCEGGDLLGVDETGHLSPVRVPADATNLEIDSEGRVSWFSLTGDGKPQVGARLAVTRAPNLEECPREGAFFRWAVYHPDRDSTVAQGYLEYPRVDAYEMHLVGGTLMQAAGLPPCQRESSPPPRRTFPAGPPLTVPGGGMFNFPAPPAPPPVPGSGLFNFPAPPGPPPVPGSGLHGMFHHP